MSSSFSLQVIASNKIFFSGKSIQLIFPAEDGEWGILAHHDNMVAGVEAGDLRLQKEDGSWLEAAVGTGFVQVANNRVTVLVDTAEKPEEIDVMRAQQALERAEEQLRQKQSLQEFQSSQASLARAMSRLRVSGKIK